VDVDVTEIQQQRQQRQQQQQGNEEEKSIGKELVHQGNGGLTACPLLALTDDFAKAR
jgi:hypothetical protein